MLDLVDLAALAGEVGKDRDGNGIIRSLLLLSIIIVVKMDVRCVDGGRAADCFYFIVAEISFR